MGSNNIKLFKSSIFYFIENIIVINAQKYFNSNDFIITNIDNIK